VALALLLGVMETKMSEVVYSTIKEETPLSFDGLRKTMRDFRAKHGRPLKAIKVSDATVRQMEQMFPIYPSQERVSTLYSIPIQIDNDLELWECVPVYA
jgi:hypothetical protein